MEFKLYHVAIILTSLLVIMFMSGWFIGHAYADITSKKYACSAWRGDTFNLTHSIHIVNVTHEGKIIDEVIEYNGLVCNITTIKHCD